MTPDTPHIPSCVELQGTRTPCVKPGDPVAVVEMIQITNYSDHNVYIGFQDGGLTVYCSFVPKGGGVRVPAFDEIERSLKAQSYFTSTDYKAVCK